METSDCNKSKNLDKRGSGGEFNEITSKQQQRDDAVDNEGKLFQGLRLMLKMLLWLHIAAAYSTAIFHYTNYVVSHPLWNFLLGNIYSLFVVLLTGIFVNERKIEIWKQHKDGDEERVEATL